MSFPPESERSHKANIYFSQPVAIIPFSVVIRDSLKAKSQISSFENLRGIVRQSKS